MGYLHIPNLSREQDILNFKRVWAMEKCHGTSAHFGMNGGQLKFFAGGEKYENFIKLFDSESLLPKLLTLGHHKVTVYGEAYGGRCQGMSDTYGKALKFVAFDVHFEDIKGNGAWVNVPTAHKICTDLGVDFVPYELVSTDLDILNAERDRPSRIAIRNGCGHDKKAEGIVLRPPFEVTLNNGNRLIAKHKRSDFSERKSKADTEVNPEKVAVLTAATAIAEEWVVPMRLHHVLDKLQGVWGRDMTIEDTTKVIEFMVADVTREGAGEIVETPETFKAIRSETAKLFRKHLQEALHAQVA
jgi:hypothetical protein